MYFFLLQYFPWMQVSSNCYKIAKAEIVPFDIERNDYVNMEIYIEK